MKRRVADIIIETLVDLGVRDCFAVVGGGAMHLDNALAQNDDMHVVFNHHEQACAMAAEGYARESGQSALVCVTSGPGATNAITGVMGAWVDSVPMVVLSGQVRYETSVRATDLNLRYRGTQEFDIIPSVSNMTKYAAVIVDPLSARREVRKAYSYAMQGRRGPVWLDVPLDVQSAQVEEDDLYPDEPIEPIEKPSSESIRELAQMVKNASRPCFLLGSGIITSGAWEKLDRFVESSNVPCVGEAWMADVYYNDSPKFYGLSGNIGPRVGNFILQNADLIVSLADSMGFRQTGFAQDLFAVNADLVMVDVCEDETKKPGLRVAKAIICDIADFFDEWDLLSEKPMASTDWVEYCNMLKSRFDPFEAAQGLSMDDRVCSYFFWKVFDEVAPEDAIITLGNNTGISSKVQVGKKAKNQRVHTNYNCGPMGLDLPISIGASVASGKEVIAATGDGSIMMNLQELETIVYNNIPVKIIVFSNDGYNAIRQTSKNFFNGTYIGCNAETGIGFPSFEKIADAFGIDYLLCSRNGDVKDCLEKLFKADGAIFMEVEQRLDDPVQPKVMSRQNEDGSFVTPSLEDMFPFLPQEEHDALMISRKQNEND